MTHAIRVCVEPEFLDERSAPDEGVYFWIYTIEISNKSELTVQLRSRYWQITDANGQSEEVRGPGVVGEQPVLPPGHSFTYTSGVPLKTASGFMSGSYQMEDEHGQLFNIEIPAFSLDCPFAVRSLN